jgi:hypothetical protein
MRRFLALALALLLLPALAGCNRNKDRGQYKDLDKPRSEKQEKK